MRFNIVAGMLIAASVVISGCAAQKQVSASGPLMIQQQGSFATVVR